MRADPNALPASESYSFPYTNILSLDSAISSFSLTLREVCKSVHPNNLSCLTTQGAF